MINMVSATRLTKEDFWGKSALGLSLLRLQFDERLKPFITYENKQGLSSVYNAGLMKAQSNDLMVFIHDDVWLDDHYFADRIIDGLETYDVLGVAGNKRRQPNQSTWITVDESFTFDADEYLAGSIGIGKNPCGVIKRFGSSPETCELMDGVLLATKRDLLIKNSCYFDPRFDFHFYDLDFCRTARSKNLNLGTWPISLTHQGEGVFGTPSWIEMYQRYIEKWGE